jgi:hypothetical protein
MGREYYLSTVHSRQPIAVYYKNHVEIWILNLIPNEAAVDCGLLTVDQKKCKQTTADCEKSSTVHRRL